MPQAVVDVCQATGIAPQHASAQYKDYTALNTTLDSLIEVAKQALHVRLLGAVRCQLLAALRYPAAWSISTARAQPGIMPSYSCIWTDVPLISRSFIDTLGHGADG